MTATVKPDNATNKSVTWSSDNESVATVADGVVTAAAAGTAVITVTTTDGGFTTACVVTVTNPLAEAKAAAKAELDAYKNADDYRDAEKSDLAAAIAAGNAAIDDAMDTDAVAAALATAKAVIDAIKTDVQLTAEEQAAADQAAADEVIAKINAIGTVEYMDACKEKIDDAREAYNNLTIRMR